MLLLLLLLPHPRREHQRNHQHAAVPDLVHFADPVLRRRSPQQRCEHRTVPPMCRVRLLGTPPRWTSATAKQRLRHCRTGAIAARAPWALASTNCTVRSPSTRRRTSNRPAHYLQRRGSLTLGSLRPPRRCTRPSGAVAEVAAVAEVVVVSPSLRFASSAAAPPHLHPHTHPHPPQSRSSRRAPLNGSGRNLLCRARVHPRHSRATIAPCRSLVSVCRSLVSVRRSLASVRRSRAVLLLLPPLHPPLRLLCLLRLLLLRQSPFGHVAHNSPRALLRHVHSALPRHWTIAEPPRRACCHRLDCVWAVARPVISRRRRLACAAALARWAQSRSPPRCWRAQHT